MTGNPLFPELEAELEAARAEYARLSTEIVAAEAAYERAFRAREDGQGRWNAVVVRINRACGSGSIEGGGPSGTLSPVLSRLLDQERVRYDATGAALTKAKRHLEQLRWEVSGKVDDITTIERLVAPPSPPVIRDIRTRDREPVEGVESDADIIIMPVKVA